MNMTGVAVHHFGGRATNSFASTKDFTFDEVNVAHRTRWPDFPSEMNPNVYIGYNVIIFPDGSLIQARLIGEETAAQIGRNRDVISICLAGNFTRRNDGMVVDYPTAQQVNTLQRVGEALLSGIPQTIGLRIKTGTRISIKLQDFHPHRFYWNTDCFGTALPDTWARDTIAAGLRLKLSLAQQALELLTKLLFLMKAKGLAGYRESCVASDHRG